MGPPTWRGIKGESRSVRGRPSRAAQNDHSRAYRANATKSHLSNRPANCKAECGITVDEGQPRASGLDVRGPVLRVGDSKGAGSALVRAGSTRAEPLESRSLGDIVPAGTQRNPCGPLALRECATPPLTPQRDATSASDQRPGSHLSPTTQPTVPTDQRLRLWAVSDLHVSHAENRAALQRLPSFPNDWLILGGDVTHGVRELDWCFRQLTPKFRQIVWVPGNHELWTVPNTSPNLRGVDLYEHLVGIARSHGVLTPEDPYQVVELRTGPVMIVPLFLLYDYSYRPRYVLRSEVVRWASEAGSVCSDELLLHADPFPDRDSWCAARCRDAAIRLADCPSDIPKVLVNHFPLEEGHAVLPLIPRFTPWCGTRRTRGWHRRFNACAVVYGHLHIRGTRWLDGVPFQEVSLGYPRQWQSDRGIEAYMREVTLASTSRII